jgi:KEOPS complex subunit Pcc1
MKKKAVIQLELPSENFAAIVMRALQPETKRRITSRSRVALQYKGSRLIIKAEANDTSALRASLNSYLRWIGLVRDTIETAESLSPSL